MPRSDSASTANSATEAHSEQEEARDVQTQIVDVGDQAPDFTLPSAKHGNLSLSGLRGKKVLIAFYPRDFTGG